MRTLISAFVLVAFLCVSANQAAGQPLAQPLGQASAAPNPPTWSSLQALPAGTNIHVKAAKRNTTCKFTAATADTLTCAHPGAAAESFARPDIKWVKLPHRGRSAAIGAIPGLAVIGVAGIAGATENCGNEALLCGLGYALLGALGLVLVIAGSLVGYFTDFSAPKIYQRP